MSGTGENRILRVGLLAPVDSLDPRGAWDMGRALIASQIYETPCVLRGSPPAAEPLLFAENLAQETPAGGEQLFRARMREGVRFSDGSPHTAAEAAATLRQCRHLADQAAIDVRGDELRFRLEHANARLDLALTILDCAMVRDGGDDLLGTGPYVPEDRALADELRLVRNPHYRAPAAIPELLFKVYPPEPDGAPRGLLEALERGEVDFTNVLSSQHLHNLRRVRKHLQPGNSTALLFFNTERLPEPTVRRAIATAIDRKQLAGLFYPNPLANTATGLLPPFFGGSLDGILHDREQAGRLLARSSGRLPGKLTLLVIWSPRPYLPQPQRVAQMIAGQLSAIGIEVEVEMSAGADDLGRRIAAGAFDLYLGGWIADTPDPVDFLEALLSSRMIPAPGRGLANQANFSRWRCPPVDEAIDRLRRQLRGSDAVLNQISRRVAEEMPVFPLLYGSATTVHTWRLQGFELSPIGHPRFAEMRFA